MRKVVVCELRSLDGVAEKPRGVDWDDVMDANLDATTSGYLLADYLVRP